MKHIVFVIGHYKNGGVAMRSTNLANEFANRGYNVSILVTKDIGSQLFFDLHKNVKIVLLSKFVEDNKANPIIVSDNKKRENLIRRYNRLRNLFACSKKISAKYSDRIKELKKGNLIRRYMLLTDSSVYIPFGISYYEETYYGINNSNNKIIYAERNAPEVELPKDEAKKHYYLNLLSKADGAVFQTFDEQHYYSEYISQNVAIIHNPIKANLPEPYKGERRKVIVNYCRIAKQKNLRLLVDSFAKLYNDYKDYTLEIYGNTVGENEELLFTELKEYVSSLGLDNVIRVLPPAADVHNRVRDCAMFVSSSDFEGLSNSMIEAMAIGLPCVCTDCLGGGAREVIQHEINGLLVPIHNVDALYRAMKRFIEDPKFAEECGKNASKN